MLTKSLLALAFAGLSTANCGASILEKTPVLPSGWETLEDAVDPSHPLRLSFAIRQPSMGLLDNKMGMRRYFSANCSAHMSREEAQNLRTPHQEDVDAVMKWLSASGCTKTSNNGAWVHLNTTVGEAEKLLGMKVNRYAYEDKKPVLRAREYTVPEYISEKITFVHPIANFMPGKPSLLSIIETDLKKLGLLEKRQQADTPCRGGTTPNCIRKLYNMPLGDLKMKNATSPIRFGIAGFLEENANYNDVHDWMFNYAEEIEKKDYNFTVDSVNSGNNNQDVSKSGPEAALDVEYAMALGYPTNITYYATGGRGPKLNTTGDLVPDDVADNEPYLEFLDHLLALPDSELPHVLSVSYADDELSVPRAYAERVCSMFGLLTARGTTILAGSGDGGARGSSNSNCRTNDGSNKEVTMSVFPASCPWVTAIGAVSGESEPPKGASFSGGGFSQYFDRPSWQRSDVDGYIKALDGQLKGYYQPSKRAVPDISAIGTDFIVQYKGKAGLLQGTSASTPVIAAMIALINNARVKRGKPVLGWINQLLYTDEVKAVIQDVTSGNSKPCLFVNGLVAMGWPAKEGWDAITGLGVPKDFQKLMKVLVDA